MLRNFITFGGTVVGILATSFIFIADEAWFIALILYLGAIKSYIIFPLVFIPISILVFDLYLKVSKKSSAASFIERWIKKREQEMYPKYFALARFSKILAVIFSSVISGIFITSILIGILGFRGKKAYSLIVMSCIIFFGIWVGIYSGLIKGLSIVIK